MMPNSWYQISAQSLPTAIVQLDSYPTPHLPTDVLNPSESFDSEKNIPYSPAQVWFD